jgi:hypothetical protein
MQRVGYDLDEDVLEPFAACDETAEVGWMKNEMGTAPVG